MRQGIYHGPAVYFVQFGKKSPMKIGFSRNLGVRIAILQTAHWQKLTRIVAVPGDRKMEKRIHAQFADQRIARTEWFHPDPELVAFVDELDAEEMIDVLRESIAMAKKVDVEKVFEGTRGQPKWKPSPEHPWRARSRATCTQ
jgi:hypothetical protein